MPYGQLLYTILAFLGLQLQGTLYNYYYVILRNKYNGDTTSRVFEDHTPVALEGETQRAVNIWYTIYQALYGLFDKVIYSLDRNAPNSKPFPNWFMTAVSTFGLGFQLLLIAIMMVLNVHDLIIPFFLGYSIFIGVFIAIRKLMYSEQIGAGQAN